MNPDDPDDLRRLRDQAALAALTGLLANPNRGSEQATVYSAVIHAQALMKALYGKSP